jgi:hypothetical protein
MQLIVMERLVIAHVLMTITIIKIPIHAINAILIVLFVMERQTVNVINAHMAIHYGKMSV